MPDPKQAPHYSAMSHADNDNGHAALFERLGSEICAKLAKLTDDDIRKWRKGSAVLAEGVDHAGMTDAIAFEKFPHRPGEHKTMRAFIVKRLGE